jgi:CRISPR/Cas system CMR-associated protein Cmr5 small subunit
MKCYIQNGTIKKLSMAHSFQQALLAFVKTLIKVDSDGNTSIDCAPLTYASDYGFYTDIKEVDNPEQLMKVIMERTDTLLEKIGHFDLACKVREDVKNWDESVQQKFNSINDGDESGLAVVKK